MKELGPDHVHVATTYRNFGQVHRELGNLGRVHHKQGHLKKARDYDNRARAIFLKKLGPDHVHVATTYSSLGQVHRELGNLGRVHHKQGHLKKARDYDNRARAIFVKKLGPDHVHVATTYRNFGQMHRELGNLGRVHHKQGHLKKVRDYNNRARAIFLEKLGPGHVHVATTYSSLGQVQRELSNLRGRLLSSCIRHFT